MCCESSNGRLWITTRLQVAAMNRPYAVWYQECICMENTYPHLLLATTRRGRESHFGKQLELGWPEGAPLLACDVAFQKKNKKKKRRRGRSVVITHAAVQPGMHDEQGEYQTAILAYHISPDNNIHNGCALLLRLSRWRSIVLSFGQQRSYVISSSNAIQMRPNRFGFAHSIFLPRCQLKTGLSVWREHVSDINTIILIRLTFVVVCVLRFTLLRKSAWKKSAR